MKNQIKKLSAMVLCMILVMALIVPNVSALDFPVEEQQESTTGEVIHDVSSTDTSQSDSDREQIVESEALIDEISVPTTRAYEITSVPLTLKVSSYSAPFMNGNTGEHTVRTYTAMQYISKSAVGSSNSSGSATAYFRGSNSSGWTLYIDVQVGNYSSTWSTGARVTNKDMSNATGYVSFGLSFNSSGGTSTYISISGAMDIPDITANYQVKYLDAATGSPIRSTANRSGSVGTTVSATTADKTIEGYTFNSNLSTASATLTTSGTVLTLYFDKNPVETTYKVEWYDQDGQKIKEDTRTANVGDNVSVTEADKVLEGYTFDAENANNVLTDVTAEDGSTTLKLYFIKNSDEDPDKDLNMGNHSGIVTPPNGIMPPCTGDQTNITAYAMILLALILLFAFNRKRREIE